ncbi:MAG: aminopeptidase [Verrucomicrobiota bacterium]|jgi:predicted aminopeptidase
MPKFPQSRRARAFLLFLGSALMLAALSGCETVGYYRQAIAGEYQILAHQEPIQKLIDDPATPAPLKAKFEQVLKITQFAASQLSEPSGANYLNYVDLHRPCVVWNVNVAPALSLQPKTWWFLVVGSASYRGYFKEQSARRYAAKWEKRGWDTYVDGVETYSTLGWFHDPLLNTFISEPDWELAEIIFHELAHQRLFVPGDTDFNEAFATAVAAEGVRRWFLSSGNSAGYAQYQKTVQHENDFVELVMAARAQLQSVYADARLPEAAKLQRKGEIIRQLRDNYVKTKTRWGGQSGYDQWFAEPINNAKLNTVAAYYDLVPAFQALLRAQDGDMEKFYRAVAALAKLPLTKRHEDLRAYLPSR